MNKSKRTQQRYQRAFRGQGKLTGFGFKAPSYPPRVKGPKSGPKVIARPVASEEPTNRAATRQFATFWAIENIACEVSISALRSIH